MKYRIRILTATAAAVLTPTAGSLAAIINPTSIVVGNGNGTVSSIVITNVPGNDNVTVVNNPNIQVNGKNFIGNGPVDIIFTTTNTALTSEYFVGEGVTNSTGAAWTDYIIQLGFGAGRTFTPSGAGDGLDFDFPTFDPAPTAGAGTFNSVVLGEDQLTFTGGFGVPDASAVALSFSIDVPDGLQNNTFTLRQIPIAVPEPATLGTLTATAAIGLRRRRRA